MEAIERWAPRVIFTLLFIGAGAAILGSLTAGPADAPRPVDFRAAERTATAAKSLETDLRIPMPKPGEIGAEGIVEPADRAVSIGASVPGVIAKIQVREGEKVQAGQPLITLEDEVQKAALAVATADLDAARAQEGRIRAGSRPEQRRALSEQAKAAQAKAALSALTLHRLEVLRQKNAASAEDYDEARYRARIDAANAQAQASQAAAARHGWKRDLEVAHAQVEQARGRLEQAKAQLAQRIIRAPSSGTVLQVLVRPGEYYNPGGPPLIRMGDLSKIRVRLDVTELDIAKVHLGQRGYVVAEAFGARRFPGKVVDIARRMGRKNVRSDEPTARIDTKILEVVLQLEDGHDLVQGLRVFGFLEPGTGTAGARG